jgi:hypothetical protein
VTDIFQEVEEDVRRERLEKLWKQYGDYVFVAVAAVAIGVAGYKLWDRYELQQKYNAAKTFTAAQEAADAGNANSAAQTFAKLSKTAPGGYAALSKLAEANSLMMAGNRTGALQLYKEIADKGEAPLADVARIRAAWAMVEFAPRSEIEPLLAPINNDQSEWRTMAREILAYADYRAGALQQAQKEFQALADDKNVPRTMHQRVDAMATFLKAGGDKNAGTVPQQKPEAPAGTQGVPPGILQQLQNQTAHPPAQPVPAPPAAPAPQGHP